MYLRHGFRRPNFVPKFGASVMGIGPYALRGTGVGTPGRRALRVGAGGFINCPGGAGAQRSVRARSREGWAGIGARTIPKGGPPPRPLRQRLAKRKARKEKLVKFDFCPTTSECSTAHNVRKSQQSPARAPADITSTEQNRLAPHPAARQGALRARNCAATSVFSFDGSTAVFFLARQKENGGGLPRVITRHHAPFGAVGTQQRAAESSAPTGTPQTTPPADAIRRKPRPLGRRAKEKRSHVSRF